MKTLTKKTTRICSPQKWLRVWLLCCFLVFDVFADYRFDSWDTEDGLPQNSVRAVLQTADGYLWFTTLDGLVRFDGARFTVFNARNSAGLAGNRLVALHQTADGALWIGAENGAFSRFQNGEFQSFAKDDLPVKELARSLGGEFLLFAAGEFVPIPTAQRSNFAHKGQKSGALWYADAEGLRRIGNDAAATSEKFTESNEITITLLYEDRAGILWIAGRNGGVYRLTNGEFVVFQSVFARGENATAIFEDNGGRLWFGTSGGGLYEMRGGQFVEIVSSPEQAQSGIVKIYQDRENTLWLGTENRGLRRLDRQTVSVLSKADGLSEDNVFTVFETKAGDIWIGGNYFLNLYRDNSFVRNLGQNAPEKPIVLSFEETANGDLWIGLLDGLYKFKDGVFANFKERIVPVLGSKFNVYEIHEDRGGKIWLGTDKGLLVWDGERVERHFTVRDNLAGDRVAVIHETAAGDLWIGTNGGLSLYRAGAFTNFTRAEGLSSNSVRSIYEDAAGTFWIGTYDGGLNRFRDGEFVSFTTSEGLFNDGVFQIFEDFRGNFWMTSNRGIYRVAKTQLEDFAAGKTNFITSVAYGKRDGLLNTEFNGGRQPAGIRTRGGSFWFPTQGGVAIVDPREIVYNPLPPPVVIESVKINDQISKSAPEIRIEPDQNYLEITYTGLSFIKPENVRFKYRLAGLDADWVEAGTRRTAYYSYLPPGEYEFGVKAANADGVWNASGATVKIKVLPPFYRTWWFFAVLCGALVAVGYAVYSARVSRLEKRRRAQEAFSRQLIESQEKERKRIAAELHDGLGQSLVIIKNRAVLGQEKRENAGRAFEQLDEIAQAATAAIDEVREITYNLRPYQLDRLGLTKAVESMIRRASDRIEFQSEIDDLDGAFPKDAEINVYRIAQETVNNIVKHSGAGKASVRVKRTENAVEMIVGDDGRGFETGNGTAGFGLIGIEERARMLGGSLSIESAAGRGTIVFVKLPVAAKNEKFYEQ